MRLQDSNEIRSYIPYSPYTTAIRCTDHSAHILLRRSYMEGGSKNESRIFTLGSEKEKELTSGGERSTVRSQTYESQGASLHVQTFRKGGMEGVDKIHLLATRQTGLETRHGLPGILRGGWRVALRPGMQEKKE